MSPRGVPCPSYSAYRIAAKIKLLKEACGRHERDGIEQVGRDVTVVGESHWMVPLLVGEERDKLVTWELGVSLYPFGG
jgi:hypothetical protein